MAASPITSSGDAKRPFSVDGDTFTDFQSAAERSCDNQKNGCVHLFTLLLDYLYDGGAWGGFKREKRRDAKRREEEQL